MNSSKNTIAGVKKQYGRYLLPIFLFISSSPFSILIPNPVMSEL